MGDKTATKITISRVIIMAILCCVLVLFYVFIYEKNIASADSYADEEYPPYIYSTDYQISLGNDYIFECDYDDVYYTDNVKCGIWKLENGVKIEIVNLDNRDIRPVGENDGLYYFNELNSTSSKAVYTYKPGDKKIKKLKNTKRLNFIPFKKSDDFFFKTGGLQDKRYALGVDFYPTDAAGAYHVYVYDLKKNIKRSLGYAFDVARDGKKLYWVTTSNFKYTKKTKILVKCSSLNGKNKKTYKSYKAGFLKNSYGRGEINKHYVKWSYFKTKKQ